MCRKRAVLFAGLLLFISASAAACLGFSNLRLKQSLRKDLNIKVVREELDLKRHKKVKEELKRRLEEKYRADMVSSRAASRRLEQEQSRQNQKEEAR